MPASRILYSLALIVLSAATSAKDFGVVAWDRTATQTQRANSTNEIIIKNRDGFEGEVTVELSVDPPVYGLQPRIGGKESVTVRPDNQVLEVDTHASSNVPPGEYEVTVTVKGEKDGKPVTRIATYTITIAPPPEFDLSLAPPHLIIKQGASGSTTITTEFGSDTDSVMQLAPYKQGMGGRTKVLTGYKEVREAVIELVPILKAKAIGMGITTQLSGGGWQAPQYFPVSRNAWLVTRDPDATAANANTEQTVLTVNISPETPPGDYELAVDGVYNPYLRDGNHLEGVRTRHHEVPLRVTVIADPAYQHLQDPPNFDLSATEPVIVIAAGNSGYYGRETEIVVWGDRWESEVKLSVAMRQPAAGIVVAFDRLPGGRLRLPTNNRAYGHTMRIVVPEGTPPGTYVAEVTAVSKALNGKTLSKTVPVQIVVPEPEGGGVDPEDPLAAYALPGGMTPEGAFGQFEGNALGTLVAGACELLSEAVETIACSVHTFKKPDTATAKPKAGVSIGESTDLPAEAGGGTDTEVFIRNPDDNNLRNGCGDLTPDLLNQLTGFPWPPADPPGPAGSSSPLIVPVACNAAAGDGEGKKAIIRNKRDLHNMDYSAQRRENALRRQGKNQLTMDDSNRHLIVRDIINDAIADAPNVRTCSPPKPASRLSHGDVKLDKVPENGKKIIAAGANMVNAELEDIKQLDGFLELVDQSADLTKNLGTEFVDLKRMNAAAKFGRGLADLGVKSASGERITASDLKTVTSAVADITGNKAVQTVANSFEFLAKLENLKLKIKNGQRVETSDVKDLVDQLDTVRGDRFAALGQVLGGIKKHADSIVKAEEFIKQMEKVSDFLDKAEEGRNDSLKAFDAFSEYLDMLGAVAGKVPGMGEFMEQYAEAVKRMKGDVQKISDAVEMRNRAIREFDSAVEGYDYDKLMLDADGFEEDYAAGGAGPRLSANQINVNLNTADELARAEDARRIWRNTQRCIVATSARMHALAQNSVDLAEEFRALPPQGELDAKAEVAKVRADYLRGVGNDSSKMTSTQARFMGFDSVRDAKAFMENEYNTARGGLDRYDDAAREAGRREIIKRSLRENYAAYQELRKKRDDCQNRLHTSEQAYWQALRDYVKKYSFLSTYLETDPKLWNAANGLALQRKALLQLDAQIIKQGFAVAGDRVEITVVGDCEEEKTLVSVGG